MSINNHQKPPEPNSHPHVVDLVIEDLKDRKRVGIERYGVALQPFNGRSQALDAYQEAQDLTVYFRAHLYEVESYRNALQTIIEYVENGAPSWEIAEIASLALAGETFLPPEPESADADCLCNCGECPDVQLRLPFEDEHDQS